MKDSTKDFIIEMTVIISIASVFLLFVFGIGYMFIVTETEDQQMYNKCMDTCERVFQEQKLIECISTCNNMNGGNQTGYSQYG
jgi:sensor histidine kinase regulating citrate/malate metabolism